MLEIAGRKLKLLSQIGIGSLAEIYAARDLASGETLAVKILRDQWHGHSGKEGRFYEEGTIGSVFEHPNVLDYMAPPEKIRPRHILMELVDGITLDKLLIFEREDRKRFFPSLIRQLAAAIAHVHARDYVHRDVNPHNIMVTEDNHLKLIDFGLCIGLKNVAGMEWQRCGTPGFMAPEQIRFTTDLTVRADIYSVASVVYALIAGHDAFTGATPQQTMTAQINRDPPRPSSHNRAVPGALDDLLLAAMSRIPAQRPGNAEQFAASVCRLAEEAGIFQ